MTGGYITDPPKDVKAAVQLHDLRDPATIHDNLESAECICRRQTVVYNPDYDVRNGVEPTSRFLMKTVQGSMVPVAQPKKFTSIGSGPSCSNCGNITILQGACWLCQTCGTTTGCG